MEWPLLRIALAQMPLKKVGKEYLKKMTKPKYEEDQEKETKKILSEEERVANFVDSDDWKSVKKILVNKLISFDSILGIPKENKTFEELGKEAVLRDAVAQIVIEWVKDIEGTAVKSKQVKEIMEAERQESIIQFF